MADYVRWRRPDRAPFDPWLRVHWRLGARTLQVASRSMVIDGRVAEWEAWTGMLFSRQRPLRRARRADADHDRSAP